MSLKKITDKFVERAERGRHYDHGIPGFGVYIGATKKSYFIEYPIRLAWGSQVRRFTFAEHGMPAPDGETWTAEKARCEAERLRELIKDGKDPLEERKRLEDERRKLMATVADLAAAWLAEDQAEHRSLKEHRRIVERYILPEIGHLRVREVEKRHILRLLESISERGKRGMAGHTFDRLRRMFRWGVARGWSEHDPTEGLERPSPKKKPPRVLKDDELVTVWRAAERIGFPYGHIIRLLILTGCRREEIGGLCWSEVHDLDGTDPRIELEGDRTKTGEPHIVPLSGPAVDILKDCPRAGGAYVFGRNGRYSFQGWSRAKRRLDARVAELAGAPLKEWCVHDLRRACATGLQRLGVRLEVTEAVLGHVSGTRGGIVGLYQCYRYERERRQALAEWAEKITTLVRGPEAKGTRSTISDGRRPRDVGTPNAGTSAPPAPAPVSVSPPRLSLVPGTTDRKGPLALPVGVGSNGELVIGDPPAGAP
ncbi:MAG TPA: DUF4102 domain-containing protein [Rhodospirillales bacterium]|nr:DUF4102 domain-containing protein [Rhodospirillales bacterium]